MPADEGQAQDPMQQLVEMAIQAVQSNDPNMAMQVCQYLVQLAQGGAEEQAAPAEEEPTAEEGEPVYARGGVLVGRLR